MFCPKWLLINGEHQPGFLSLPGNLICLTKTPYRAHFKSLCTLLSLVIYLIKPPLLSARHLIFPNRQSGSQKRVTKCKSTLPSAAFPCISTHRAADRTNKVSGSYKCVSKHFAICCSAEKMMQRRWRYPSYYTIQTQLVPMGGKVSRKWSLCHLQLFQSSIMWFLYNSTVWW